MSQFRPNVVIDGKCPNEEHQWQEIQIGDVRFLNGKSCVHCSLTTRNPDTNQVEILRTMP
ncbi:MOSC domain-containing protein [Lonepinella sp. BR2271]|uniref:MOSC domain-containing protein n=1 Tax=Lonepinella sp. BR2271 TaxID=3434550 RepID=UPI003F6DF4E9